MKGSGSLRPVARDVGIGGLAEVVGGAVPRVAKGRSYGGRVTSRHVHDVSEVAQAWWGGEGSVWTGGVGGGREGVGRPETGETVGRSGTRIRVYRRK